MFNTTRRQFLKLFGLVGTLFAGGAVAAAPAREPINAPVNPFDDLESLDVDGLHCPPAIPWEVENQFTADLVCGKLKYANGSDLVDKDGNPVDREALFDQIRSNSDYKAWLARGEESALDVMLHHDERTSVKFLTAQDRKMWAEAYKRRLKHSINAKQ